MKSKVQTRIDLSQFSKKIPHKNYGKNFDVKIIEEIILNKNLKIKRR
jgi:hypothetical protein